jgi:hypothetical protein
MVQGEAGVGQEPDDQVLVLADPLDALFGGVDDLSQGWPWAGWPTPGP